MCGKGFVPGLLFRGEKANQALSPAGYGRIHWDRELCKSLENFEEKKVERVAFVPKDEIGSSGDVGEREHSDPVGPVGPDRGDDGPKWEYRPKDGPQFSDGERLGTPDPEDR